jgi:hypothetical protein
MAQATAGTRKKGKDNPLKIPVNWRMLKTVIRALDKEAKLKGFSSIPAFLNNLLVRYFNGETIKRDP